LVLHQGQAFFRNSPDNKLTMIMLPIKSSGNEVIAYVQGELSRDSILRANELYVFIDFNNHCNTLPRYSKNTLPYFET
jgi:TnpA family transposase